MEKYIYDENNGLWYELQGELLFAVPTLPPEEERLIRIWEHRHLCYIKEHKRLLYVNLLMSGRLSGYLADINEQAEELLFWLVKQFADKEGITEGFKSAAPMFGLVQ